MAAQVLGISGSPVPNSNTDRAIQAVLEATEMPSEFVKLSALDIHPCRACLGCYPTNQCVVEDDASPLADKFRWARAFVIGGYTPYSSLDSSTKMFMERMYCLRHRTGLNRGKVGAAVITSACRPETEGLPPAAQTALNQIGFWMTEEGMSQVGSLVIMGNVPCIRCGYGDDCTMSGIRMIEGPQATVQSVGVRKFEDAAELVDSARQLGRRIREALATQPSLSAQ